MDDLRRTARKRRDGIDRRDLGHALRLLFSPGVRRVSTAFGESIDASTPVRTVRENGLTALVSDALQPQYNPSRANVGAHERIVREAYEGGGVLPMRFGTVARDDAAVERFLHERHEEPEKSIEKLQGRAELALKVLWDRDAMLGEIVAEDERIRALREENLAQPEAEMHDQRVELGRLVNEAMDRKRNAEADRILERASLAGGVRIIQRGAAAPGGARRAEHAPRNRRDQRGSEFATKEAAVLEKLRAFRSGNEAGGAMA